MQRTRVRAPLALGLLLVAFATTGCSGLEIRMLLRDGNALYNAQKFEEAAQEYEKILAIDPDHWEANYLVAISYMQLFHPGSTHPKDTEYANKAIGAFETTMALPAPDEESVDRVRNYYLSMLTLTNRSDKAIAYLEKLRQEDPNDVEVMSQLASLYAKRGEYDRASSLFETRAKANPQDKIAWYALGVLLWEQVHYGASTLPAADREAAIERGIDAFERALAIDDKYFDALSYINLMYREKAAYLGEINRYDEATAAIAKADEYRAQANAVKGQTTAGEAPAGS